MKSNGSNLRGRGALPLLPLLEAARWHSALGAGLAVRVGGRLAGAAWSWEWLHPMAIAVLLSAAGNAYNDAGDVAADRINRPTRPIPRGALTAAQARGFAYSCAALALLLALPLGIATVTGTVAGIGLLFAYTPLLKRLPLVGNGVVGLLVAMCVGFGGLMAENVSAVLLPGAAIGLLFGGREVLKTLYDVTGDRAVGAPTAATVWGARGALAIATLCFGAALLLFTFGALQEARYGWVPVAVAALLALILLPLWVRPRARRVVGFALGASKVLGLLLLAGLAV